MNVENLLVAAAVIVAALYVARSFRPRRRSDKGCDNCSASSQRRDDYT